MPGEYQQYKHPPIREAIFAITFKDPILNEKLQLFTSTAYAKETFPVLTPNVSVELTTGVKAGFSATHKQEGFMLRTSPEGNRLLTLRPTQISYHNLNKYAGWDIMYAELKVLWSHFCSAVGAGIVSQISVRYINQISLPLSELSAIGDYIQLLPQIPQGINSDLNNFFLQINVTDVENKLQGIITETFLPQKTLSGKLLLLDLTVSKSDLVGCEETQMWDNFVLIRDYKNNLFRKCITPKTESIFEYE